MKIFYSKKDIKKINKKYDEACDKISLLLIDIFNLEIALASKKSELEKLNMELRKLDKQMTDEIEGKENV